MPEGLDYPKGAIQLAQRILEAMKQPFFINDQSIVSTVSIGISVYPKNDVEPAKLVKNADAAMYLAKEGGRNQFRFYTPELNEHTLEHLALESALSHALGKNQFVLHYQPRLAADNRTVVGFEALLRWQRENDELVSPGEFIPMLEQTGLITEVGQWVLGEACLQCKGWVAAGHTPLRISVNVSPRQFREKTFVETVEKVLIDTKLDAQHLEVELTESALLDNPTEAITTMTALKALGLRLSMDDFGTGYSSFSYLKRLPVDYLKIDRSFVRGLGENPKDTAIITAIAGVAQSLDIGLVAEGVEHAAQSRCLVDLGCQELQGFLFSKPLTSTLAEAFLEESLKHSALAG